MIIPFLKMHGLGNDYIFIDCFDAPIPDGPDLARQMSRRRFSVGGDGLVLILPSEIADARMQMFNADGSEGKMCGNAIRCVGKYLWDSGRCQKENLTVETRSGIKSLRLFPENGRVSQLEVEMGRADFTPAAIPILSAEPMICSTMIVSSVVYTVTCLSVGNPHCVVFTDDPDRLNLDKIGPAFEHHPLFPERTNTEFVRVDNPLSLTMRVWERGSGETFACGTGACAACAAAVRLGLSPADQPITVHLRGGELTITCRSDGEILMRGEARTAFTGNFDTDI